VCSSVFVLLCVLRDDPDSYGRCRIFTRWKHLLGVSYSAISLFKFFFCVLMACHWVRLHARLHKSHVSTA
jgi:hypothetical protein